MQQSSQKSSSSPKPSIVFFGNERLVTGLPTDLPILRSLMHEGYSIEAVIINNERGQSRKKSVLEIQLFAEKNNIPVHVTKSKQNLIDICKPLRSSIAVLAAYGRIVPQTVIEGFEHGIINIHPSLLPKHRGTTPIESAILNNDHETGVSIMQLSRDMDAGPIFAQQRVEIHYDTTKEVLANKLTAHGITLLLTTLRDILSGKAMPTEQNHAEATYNHRIEKKDGIVDWTKDATIIEREIRAYAGWPRSRAKLGSVDVTIISAHAAPSNNPNKKPGDIEYIIEESAYVLMVECAKGYVCIEKLIPSGKKEMDIADFLRGYKDRILEKEPEL